MSTTDAISKQRTRNWAWFWLAYTGFLFIDPIFEPSLLLWMGTVLVFLVFLAIFSVYVRVNDVPSRLSYWMIAATFLLGLATFPWNQGASCIFVYAASFIPFKVQSIRRVLLLILAELLLVLAEGYYCTVHVTPHSFFHIGWPNTLVALFLMVVIGGGNIFFAEQNRADCKLRLAQEENVALAAVAERERIARDLHDVLGHTLSLIVLKAELAKRLVETDPARASAEIGDVERTARTALAEVREAISGYSARGLAAEIESARRALDAAGVTLLAESTNEVAVQLSPQEETALALALREAVTNIVRHAQATTCRLRLLSDPGQRGLVVEDDGHHATLHEGNGLRGMRERIEAVGGRFALEHNTAAAHGTRLRLELPARTEARA